MIVTRISASVFQNASGLRSSNGWRVLRSALFAATESDHASAMLLARADMVQTIGLLPSKRGVRNMDVEPSGARPSPATSDWDKEDRRLDSDRMMELQRLLDLPGASTQ